MNIKEMTTQELEHLLVDDFMGVKEIDEDILLDVMGELRERGYMAETRKTPEQAYAEFVEHYMPQENK